MKRTLIIGFAFFAVSIFFNNLSAQTAANYSAAINTESPDVYFRFNSNLVDSVGGTIALRSLTQPFTGDYWGNSFSAATFRAFNSGDLMTNGTDLFSGGSSSSAGFALATNTGSMTFLFRTLTNAPTATRYIFSQNLLGGASNQFALYVDGTNASSDPGALKLRVGDITATLLTLTNVTYSSWYYFGVTYDEARDAGEVRWYLGLANGALSSGTVDIGDNSVIGDNGPIGFGGRHTALPSDNFRNPGNGAMDEIAIWNRELSSSEITSQFNAITGAPEPSTALLIIVALGFNAARRYRRG
jgi:hypothetical protein